MLKKILFCLTVPAVAFLTGCFAAGAENNHLKPEDFARYLTDNGIKVDNVRILPPAPFRASSGAAILVDGSEIGVYKYDSSSRVQKERIAKMAKEGRTYINGIPYPIEVYGSFMFMGLEKNRQKRPILKVIRNFE